MATVYVQEWRKKVGVTDSPVGFYVYPTIEGCVVDTERRVVSQQVRLVENQPQYSVREYTAPSGPVRSVEVDRDTLMKVKSEGFLYVESLVDLRRQKR